MAYSKSNRRGKARAEMIPWATLLALLVSATVPPVLAGDLEMAGFVENNTNYRESRGLSKVRNTAQIEFGETIDMRSHTGCQEK